MIATQNPIEQEGTYPLPERSLTGSCSTFRSLTPRPMRRWRLSRPPRPRCTRSLKPVLNAEQVVRLQQLVRGVPVADAVVRYAVNLVIASRPGQGRAVPQVHKFLTYGGSPRASQYLILGAKARAILDGRFHVDYADVRAVAVPVLRHRLVLNFHARAEGIDVDQLIRRLLEIVIAKEE